jgi:hypothetical protein
MVSFPGGNMNQKHLGKCRLCQNEKELCFSHIIPEFAYFPIYDENHRFVKIPRGKDKYEQKGMREYLLCDDCDRRIIGKWETYSSPIIKSIQDLNITPYGDQYVIHNVKYTDFKLFQLSLLWRASVASVEMFKDIHIADHEEIIRNMLLSKNPGLPEQYGCIMFVLDDAVHLQKTIWSPVKDTIDGYTCYRFLTGRIFWYFFLPFAYPKDAESFFLSPEGTLRLVKAPWSETTVIKRVSSIVAEKYNHLRTGKTS